MQARDLRGTVTHKEHFVVIHLLFLWRARVALSITKSPEEKLPMDVIGVVAEARNVAQSTIRRIENYRQGRKAFKTLRRHLGHLTEQIEEVNQLVRKFPGALPDDASGLFLRHFGMRTKELIRIE